MVKFAKNGSDVTTAAVKLSRAYTGRDLIAICSDQPFFSTDDWFIGTTSMNAGIPRHESEMTLKFRYNDLESLREVVRSYPGQIACVLLEAEAITPPVPGYLHQVKELCEQRGVVLIFDEMITGFRWHLGGAQKFHGVVSTLVNVRQGDGKRIRYLGTGWQTRDHAARGSGPRPSEGFSAVHDPRCRDARLAAALETIRIYRERECSRVSLATRKAPAYASSTSR